MVGTLLVQPWHFTLCITIPCSFSSSIGMLEPANQLGCDWSFVADGTTCRPNYMISKSTILLSEYLGPT